MSDYVMLLGENYDEMPDEELEQIVATGRLAREAESSSVRTKKTRTTSSKKVAAKTTVEIDDDDLC